MKKTLCLILAALMLLGALVSCDAGNAPEDTTLAENTTAEVTDATTTSAEGAQDAPSAESANIKVMTFNLQSAYRTDERIKNVQTVIKENPADVYCFQESNTWYGDFSGFEDLSIVRQTNITGSGCHIYYNNKALTYKKAGTYKLMKKGDRVNSMLCKHDTYCSYAVFEHKETKKQFLVINAHLDYGSNPAVRRAQAKLIVEKLETDLASYKDLPMVMVGDMNSESSEVAIKYIRNTKYFSWAKNMDGVEFVAENAPDLHGGKDGPPTIITDAFEMEFPNNETADAVAEANGLYLYRTVIDYIFVSKNGLITPLKYEVIYRNFAKKENAWRYASDHMPVMCEMVIN